jgi:predicted acetyltransferase
MDIQLEAARPSPDLAAAYLDMCREYAAWGEKDYSRITSLEEAHARIEKELRWAAGEAPAGGVPSRVFWFLSESGTVVGTGRIRPALNERFLRRGGHAGYDVRPALRGNGYATYILGFLLRELRTRGIDRALLTCDDANAASGRVIEKNGGLLEGRAFDAGSGEAVRRYWIEL